MKFCNSLFQLLTELRRSLSPLRVHDDTCMCVCVCVRARARACACAAVLELRIAYSKTVSDGRTAATCECVEQVPVGS
jgi:hypothetical protein